MTKQTDDNYDSMKKRKDQIVKREYDQAIHIGLAMAAADDPRSCECIVYAQHGVEHPRGHRESGCAFAPSLATREPVAERIIELEAHLGTEQSMHRAWRKRAEEAEAELLRRDG